jgi:hypothetical protein
VRIRTGEALLRGEVVLTKVGREKQSLLCGVLYIQCSFHPYFPTSPREQFRYEGMTQMAN